MSVFNMIGVSSGGAPIVISVDKPYVREMSSSEVVSGTSLTASIKCAVGDLILAVAVHRSTFTTPSGWTLLFEGSSLSSGTYNQKLVVMYKIADSTVVSCTITQSTSARLYLNLHDIRYAGTPIIGETLISASSGTIGVTYNKEADALTMLACHTVYWATSSPYPLWTITPDISRLCQLGQTTQPRLLTFVDDLVPRAYLVKSTTTDPFAGVEIIIPTAM